MNMLALTARYAVYRVATLVDWAAIAVVVRSSRRELERIRTPHDLRRETTATKEES